MIQLLLRKKFLERLNFPKVYAAIITQVTLVLLAFACSCTVVVLTLPTILLIAGVSEYDCVGIAVKDK